MTNLNKKQLKKKDSKITKVNRDKFKIDLIQRLLEENHELKQVCLEVLRGLERTDRPPLIELHWCEELRSVLLSKRMR